MKTGKNKKFLKDWSARDLISHCQYLTYENMYKAGKSSQEIALDNISAAIQWKSEKDKQEFKPDYSSDYWRLKT